MPLHASPPPASPAFAPADDAIPIPIDVPLQPVLVEQTELFHTEIRDCLARVESVLSRAEAALSNLQVVPIVSSLPCLRVGSTDGVVAGLYGEFCPRATPIMSSSPVLSSASGSNVFDEVVAPGLQVMPELSELCGQPSLPLSMMFSAKKVTPETLMVDTASSSPPVEPSQPLASMDDGALASSVLHSPVTFEKVVPVCETLFVKDLCELLASVEKASPGKGKAISCLLIGMELVEKPRRPMVVLGIAS